MYIYDYRPLLTTSRRIEHGGERTQLLFHTLVLYTRLTAENKVALLEEARSLSLSFSLLIRCQIRTLIYDRAVGNFSSMRRAAEMTKHSDG